MLHQADPEGVIVISQPAHAWVSGQLARAWRQEDFLGAHEELCFAAEQHDLGFVAWEQAPELNPATGLPYTFLELPRQTHLEIWSHGIQQMVRFGRYPALLVSMHFTMLARRHEHPSSPAEQARVNQFLEQQDLLQTTLQTSLANDFYYEPLSAWKLLEHHQQLLSLWDWLSLLLCHGVSKPERIPAVSLNPDQEHLVIIPLDARGTRVSVQPWPFAMRTVNLICEGRRLLKTYRDQEEMRGAFRAAAPVTLRFELLPA